MEWYERERDRAASTHVMFPWADSVIFAEQIKSAMHKKTKNRAAEKGEADKESIADEKLWKK